MTTHDSNSFSSQHDNLLPKTYHSKRGPCIPEGIKSILNTCQSLYPDQPNPRQVTAHLKFWLGGPDPLDYVSIYYNPGKEGVCVSHWHYVSMGLSDLHGDERVHDKDTSNANSEKMSGFGFELTFRVKVTEDQNESPPIWPVELMQSLTSYIFSSHTSFKPGDYITWNSPIDKSPHSLLTQLFIIEDAQLAPIETKLGWVSFLQVVGVSEEELNAAQSWKVSGMVDLMKEHMSTGGPYQVCDPNRSQTLFQVSESAKYLVKEAITNQEGSNFSAFTTECMWFAGNIGNAHSPTPVTSLRRSVDPKFDSSWTDLSGSSFETQEPKRIHEVTLTLCIEAFLLLPMVIKGRLKHGEHFTFRSPNPDIAITLVPEGVSGTFVSSSVPYAAKASWLQVCIPDSLMEELLLVAENYSKHCQHSQRSDFGFPSHSLHLIIYS